MAIEKRRYDDPCGVARALGVVGERWALLVVRELLLGPKRFSDLSRGLPGMSQNVLSQRLRELSYLNRGLTISLRDERSDKSHEFHSDGGIMEFVAAFRRLRDLLQTPDLRGDRIQSRRCCRRRTGRR